jgi:hypothetical protein
VPHAAGTLVQPCQQVGPPAACGVQLRRRLRLLDEPCRGVRRGRTGQNSRRAVRSRSWTRISHHPSAIATHVDIPIGHPYSTYRAAIPTAWRSSRDSVFSQARTGSLPAEVR